MLHLHTWKEFTVIAQGNRLTHHINGVIAVEAIDETFSAQTRSGVLALELRRATSLQFKDIRLKRLQPAEAPDRELP